MIQISLHDLRRAIDYVKKSDCAKSPIQDVSDADLLKLDFEKDLHMGNIRVINVVIELQRIHNLDLSMDFFKEMPDNTVGSLMNAINRQLNQPQ